MPNNNIESNERILRIISTLAENPRSSIRQLSMTTGLKYMYIRRSLYRLRQKKMISFSLMISSSIIGQHVAYIKGRGRDIDRLVEKLSRCNRTIVVFKINHGEFGLIIHGRGKEEIAEFIDVIKTMGELSEINVDYGLLPSEAMIPMKNSNLKCRIPMDCGKCFHENWGSDSYIIE